MAITSNEALRNQIQTYCTIITIIISCLGLGALIFYLFSEVTEHNPKFTISAATLSRFNLTTTANTTTTAALSYHFILNITIHNPNRYDGFYYDSLQATTYYGTRQKAVMSTVEFLAPFYQHPKNTTVLGPVEFEGENVAVFMGKEDLEDYYSQVEAHVYKIKLEVKIKTRDKHLGSTGTDELTTMVNCWLEIPLQESNQFRATQKQPGLNLKMIYWDSPESPSYQANLTDEERVHDLLQMSHARVKSLANFVANKKNSSTSFLQPNMMIIRPSIISQRPMLYLVKIGIGTFESVPSHKTYYLDIDTGSDLIWTQCEGCEPNCFHQIDPYFPASQSRSYKVLPCSECPPGAQCADDRCIVSASYVDGSNLQATAAKETFTFESSGDTFATLRLFFGCGFNMQNFGAGNMPQNRYSGIMGMNYGQSSFPNQAGPLIDGRFSYCLQPIFNKRPGSSPMFLRFGADVIQNPGMQSTPMPRQQNSDSYFLNLQGISVVQKRLDIPPEVFQLKSDGTGGCIIDSGAAFTHIVPEAYQPFEDAMTSFIEVNNQNVRRTESDIAPFTLCYERYKDPPTIELPRVTFHFENNADFGIGPTSTVVIFKTQAGQWRICLAITKSPIPNTILGANQQVNQRIIFDLKNGQLIFGPDDCSMGN